jgi:hypothetical protein
VISRVVDQVRETAASVTGRETSMSPTVVVTTTDTDTSGGYGNNRGGTEL